MVFSYQYSISIFDSYLNLLLASYTKNCLAAVG